jgi:hypothetical protein
MAFVTPPIFLSARESLVSRQSQVRIISKEKSKLQTLSDSQ